MNRIDPTARRLRSALLAGCLALAAPDVLAQGLEARVATWNIQTLTTGKKVFPDQRHVRDAAEIAFLKSFAQGIEADIFALQEIASPAAAAQIFPLQDFALCISGQFFEAHPNLGRPAAAACFDAEPLPDTPATEDLAKQFTALAVRKSAGYAVAVADVAALGVEHRDRDGAVRPVRWGLSATLARGGESVRLLNVHLKSGCFDDRPLLPISRAVSGDDCETFARQVPVLDAFVRETERPYVVLGDFNRRLDLGFDEVYRRLTGEDTPGDRADDTGLRRFPFKSPSICLPEPRRTHEYVPIDYILLSDGLRGRDFREHSPEVPDGTAPERFKEAFGDHCPKSLTVTRE